MVTRNTVVGCFRSLAALIARASALLFVASTGAVMMATSGCHTYENSRRAEELLLERSGAGDASSSTQDHKAAKPYALASHYIDILTTSRGELQSKSIGEVIFRSYKGKWQQRYVLDQDFSFGHPVRTRDGGLKGSILAAKGNAWADRFRDKDGTIFLTSASAGRHAYAIKINPDGTLKKPYRAYQVGRRNTVRKYYPLYNVAEGTIFKPHGHAPLPGTRVSGWGMYYIGQKNGNLQFKLFEINTRGEEIRPTMFEHDLSKSKDMVVRGVTIKINELKGNGVLSYSVAE